MTIQLYPGIGLILSSSIFVAMLFVESENGRSWKNVEIWAMPFLFTGMAVLWPILVFKMGFELIKMQMEPKQK